MITGSLWQKLLEIFIFMLLTQNYSTNEKKLTVSVTLSYSVKLICYKQMTLVSVALLRVDSVKLICYKQMTLVSVALLRVDNYKCGVR